MIKIKDLEKGNISNEAIKLIVKLSEGSVRDSLSLLDRAMLLDNNGNELDLKTAHKIFGYFEKSKTIDLISQIIDGNENNTLKLYKNIYISGVEPKVFLNEFLETLYYLKNIEFINLDGSNFDLNNNEFDKIKLLSKKFSKKDILMLWQFTLNNLEKIDYIKNQHQFVEMFLIIKIYLKEILKNNSIEIINEFKKDLKVNKQIFENKNHLNQDAIEQLKSVEQEEKIISAPEVKNKIDSIEINNFNKLIQVCEDKKEIKKKYEMENNLKLVSFENQKIEISFNSNLDKSFVKELSAKLLEWTKKKMDYIFFKKKGLPTIKEQKKKYKK